MAFHRSLRQEFLAIAKAEPRRCVVIDATEGERRVEDKVWAIVRERFSFIGLVRRRRAIMIGALAAKSEKGGDLASLHPMGSRHRMRGFYLA